MPMISALTAVSLCPLQVNLAQPAQAIHNWIRGHDKVPGAWTLIDGQVCFPEHVQAHPAWWHTCLSEKKKHDCFGTPS